MTETEEIQAVQGLLAIRLEDDPVKLVRQLTEIEAWHSRISFLSCCVESDLSLASYAKLMKKSPTTTEFEREKALTAATAAERRKRDILEGLCKSINLRIMLGMSLLKAQGQER